MRLNYVQTYGCMHRHNQKYQQLSPLDAFHFTPITPLPLLAKMNLLVSELLLENFK